jgi:hypothetical protein
MRVRAVGLERIATSGPRILVGAPHRRYYEAFALGIAAPAAPRIWWLGLGPFIVGRGRVRSALLRRLGGLLPVWRGTSGIDTHLNAASAVFAAGAHYGVMPEGGTGGVPSWSSDHRHAHGGADRAGDLPIPQSQIRSAEC